MEELKLKGIVLKSVDLKDSDKLITIFSLEKGIVRAKARGVKKNKAKLSFATQPFAFIECVLAEKSGYYTVTNATSIDQFFDLTADFDNFVFMMSCMEICEKCVADGDSCPQLFLLLLNSFKLVCYEGVSSSNILLKFIIESMRILGYNFEIQKCSCCGKQLNNSNEFSFDTNGFLCDGCLTKNDHVELKETLYNILRKIDDSTLENLKNLKFLSREDVLMAIRLLCRDFKIVTGEEISTIKQFL